MQEQVFSSLGCSAQSSKWNWSEAFGVFMPLILPVRRSLWWFLRRMMFVTTPVRNNCSGFRRLFTPPPNFIGALLSLPDKLIFDSSANPTYNKHGWTACLLSFFPPPPHQMELLTSARVKLGLLTYQPPEDGPHLLTVRLIAFYATVCKDQTGIQAAPACCYSCCELTYTPPSRLQPSFWPFYVSA